MNVRNKHYKNMTEIPGVLEVNEVPEIIQPTMCESCNKFYADPLVGKCSSCAGGPTDSFDTFDPLVAFNNYMKMYQPYITYVTLTDQQFELLAKKLTTDVQSIEWFKILRGLTQDFHHVFLSGKQVQKILTASTSYEYVHVIYRQCYEPWNADVGHGAGNCYWRDFAEMTKPKSREKLNKILDKLFNNWIDSTKPLGECSICLENMFMYNTWSTDCCHNAMHTACISKCDACPLCRGSYYKK